MEGTKKQQKNFLKIPKKKRTFHVFFYKKPGEGPNSKSFFIFSQKFYVFSSKSFLLVNFPKKKKKKIAVVLLEA